MAIVVVGHIQHPRWKDTCKEAFDALSIYGNITAGFTATSPTAGSGSNNEISLLSDDEDTAPSAKKHKISVSDEEWLPEDCGSY